MIPARRAAIRCDRVDGPASRARHPLAACAPAAAPAPLLRRQIRCTICGASLDRGARRAMRAVSRKDVGDLRWRSAMAKSDRRCARLPLYARVASPAPARSAHAFAAIARGARSSLARPSHSHSPAAALAAGWEPTKPVEFIVPAGTGGGADQMARLLQGVITKNNLMKQPMIVVNKSGGAGAEGFLAMKEAKGDPNKIIITLSNLFTTPLATGRAVQLEGPDARRDAGARPVRAVGQRRDALQDGQGIPRRGEGRRARTSSRWAAPGRSRKTRSSPSRSRRPPGSSSSTCRSRAAATWRSSSSASTSTRRSTTRSRRSRSGAPARCGRCACSTTSGCPTRPRSPSTMSWNDIPSCKEAGVAVDYVMLRGIFMPPGVTQGTGRFLRRPLQEGAGDRGLEEVHGGRRVQHDVHERPRLREVGREGRSHAQGSDARGRLPRQAVTAPGRRRPSGAAPCVTPARPRPAPPACVRSQLARSADMNDDNQPATKPGYRRARSRSPLRCCCSPSARR